MRGFESARSPCFALPVLAALLWGVPLRAATPTTVPDPLVYHFSHGRPGVAVAGATYLGLSARSLVMVGYGRPHWLFAAVHVQSALTSEFAVQAAGVRVVAPVAELILQARRVGSYKHPFLAPRQRYAESALSASGKAAQYYVAEAALSAYLPAYAGFIYASAWVNRLYGLPEAHFVFEEVTRAIVRGPWLGSEQLAYFLYLGRSGHHRLAPLVEHVWSSRERGGLFRLGLAFSAQFTRHLSCLAYVTEPVHSPDSLGLWASAGGGVEFRYAWSSTDPAPAFP